MHRGKKKKKKKLQRAAEGPPSVFNRVPMTVFKPGKYLGKESPKGLKRIVLSAYIGSGIVAVSTSN